VAKRFIPGGTEAVTFHFAQLETRENIFLVRSYSNWKISDIKFQRVKAPSSPPLPMPMVKNDRKFLAKYNRTP